MYFNKSNSFFSSAGFTANTIACMILPKNVKILASQHHHLLRTMVKQALILPKSRYCISCHALEDQDGNGCQCAQDRQYHISLTAHRQIMAVATIIRITMVIMAVRAKLNRTIVIDIWCKA